MKISKILNVKKNPLFVLILWGFVASCSDKDSSTTILLNDFSKRQDFKFTTPISDKDGYVEAIFIDVKGEVNGHLRITGSCGGEVKGKIDTTFRCDWYSPEASMLVIPQGEVTGKLEIIFRFSKI